MRGTAGITSLAPTAPSIGRYAFNNIPATITVNIPCGSTASYQAEWSELSNFIEPANPYTLNVQSANDTYGTAVVTLSPTCSSKNRRNQRHRQPGYRFSRWSDGNTESYRRLTVTRNITITAFFEVVVNPSADTYNVRTCTGQTILCFVDDNSRTATVTGYLPPCGGGLIVPPYFEVDGVRYTVTAIGDRAFHGCTGFISVTLPASIITIGEDAFSGCSNLQDVKMW